MKQIILAMAVLMTMNLAQAVPTDLQDTMKQMGVDFKKINVQSTNSALNADSAETAKDMASMITLARTFVPDSIAMLSADKQAAAKADYDQRLSQVLDLVNSLISAFSSNDNVKVASLLKDIKKAQGDGHDLYKQ